MALLTGSNAVNTPFTPAAGDFIVQVTGAGQIQLMRRNTSGDTFVPADMLNAGAYVVANPVAGAQYQFQAAPGASSSPTFRADQ